MKLRKCILSYVLIFVMIVCSVKPGVHAATLVTKNISDPYGTRKIDLLIGEYCFIETGERVRLPYSRYIKSNVGYFSSVSGSAITQEVITLQSLPNVVSGYRYTFAKELTDLHMAPSSTVLWCAECVTTITRPVYVSPGYGETEGYYDDEEIPSINLYPSIEYYGVNYDLDYGSFTTASEWIEAAGENEYGIWELTEAQYDKAGDLYEDNIWFAYEGKEAVLPDYMDVTKDGYELSGWGTTTGSAIVIEPGAAYVTSGSNAEYRDGWQGVNINFKAIWEPKYVGTQELSQISVNGALLTAHYDAYYDLTDQGFMYKKSSDSVWTKIGVTVEGGIMTASLTGLTSNTSYDVKGYIENKTGRSENDVVTFKTNPEPVVEIIQDKKTETTTQDNKTEIIVIKDSMTGVTGTTVVESEIGKDGVETASVSEKQISDTLDEVHKEALKLGNKTEKKVEIRVESSSESESVETSIPASAFKELSDDKTDAFIVSTSSSSITFDLMSIQSVASDAEGDIKIAISRVEPESLTEKVSDIIDDRPVFDFSVTNGDRRISEFGGTLTISLLYTPKDNEDTNAIIIYYINANGNLELIKDCIYNKATGMVTFQTNHFSQYAVGYHEIQFNDMSDSLLCNEAVSYLAARGIAVGTRKNNYEPEGIVTRGQVLVMLMRAYGYETLSELTDNYSDAGDKYYTPYLALAKDLDISYGVSGNKFFPNQRLTRQEMVAFIYDILDKIGKLPSADTDITLADFKDAAKLSGDTKEAMTLFVQSGIIQGGLGKLNPNGTATKSQLALVLYRILIK